MAGFVDNIEEITLKNENFRQVLFTGEYTQVVVMSLAPGEDIGLETHETVDQFIRIEKGNGKAILNGEENPIEDGSAILIPAGTQHNIVNLSKTEPLKLYTLYSPPQHKDKIIHKTKAEALSDETDHP